MHLKHIEIQGFKSFPDKTRISFNEPYTAIVGPNGSGKSNISDAVRWVLGEQSTKSLRGGKMEDVIFGGTQLRKSMGFAQVALCLDNDDKRVGEDVGEEVVVSRRYYRSGDSEYLINGASVRLRDVREMFMDTGLGRDGYSIIGQGRIAEIVSAKSEDRREIFEEASGIAKFRFRKNEASRRLEAAEDNLSRLRDILDELGGRIEPLTEQSEKAKEFIALSDERKSLEITLYCDTIERSRANMRAQDDKIAIAAKDYSEIEKKLLSINESIETMSDKNIKFNAEIDVRNAEIIKTGEEISRIESETAVLRNDVKHAEEQIEALMSERAGLTSDGNGILVEVDARKLTVAERKTELEALEHLIAEAESELNLLIEGSEKTNQKRGEIAKKLTDMQSETIDLKVSNLSVQSSLETSSARSALLEEQLPELQTRYNDLKKEFAENQKYYTALIKEINARTNQISGYTLKIEDRKRELDELNKELKSTDYETQELAHRAKVLGDMDKNLDGFSPGVRKIIAASETRELRGIVGTVASLISIKSGNELAIETALGVVAQNIVVMDERCAKQGIRHLKETRTGRATFLPLDTIKPSKFEARERLSDNGVIGLASELVKCDMEYNDIISNVLGRIVVAEDLDSASTVAKKMGYKYRVVTRDGQVINAGGSYTGGYTARQGGLFTRKTEIEKLHKKIEGLNKESKTTREKRDATVREVAQLEAEIVALNSEHMTGCEDKIRAEGVISRLNSDIETVGDALNDAQAELASIAAAQKDRKKLLSSSNEKLAAIASEIERLERSAGSESQSGDEFMQRRAELTTLLSERKIARVEKQKDIEGLEFAIETLLKQGDVAGDRVTNIDSAIDNLTAQNTEWQASIDGSVAAIEGMREAAAQHKRDIEKMIEERTQAERDVVQNQADYGNVAKQREDVGREISRLEERKVALQGDYDAALARLWDEYELTRNEADKLCVPFKNISELRQQVGSLRAKIKALGSVNVSAIEELKDVSKRHAFLSGQMSDVEKSKEELLKLIEQLEKEMTVIFTKSFSEISSRFRTVFVELFGGGSAKLWLSDETNVLESGIEIDVQPPGKVIKNLAALSGGEHALVAIALYFSILAINPSPFCILDEIDSALDEANVSRFAAYLGRLVDKTQIIAITHRRGTMEAADILYGVTMQEEGVSKLLKLGIEEAQLVISK